MLRKPLKIIAVVLGIVVGLSGLAFSAVVWAEEFAKSGPAQVSLLEVYSSEGCSSCPPAEDWVSARLSRHAGLWTDFVPVVFHVDYWDDLGWKDRFGDPAFTERQRRYAAAWKNNSVYTPGFILNGQEWRNWYYYDAIPDPEDAHAGILLLEKEREDFLKMTFKPEGDNAGMRACVAHVAVLGSGLISDVTAGENRGARLRHDFTVLHYSEIIMDLSADGIFQTGVSLSFPEHSADQKLGIAVWVSRENNPQPLQAAGGYFNSRPKSE